MAEIRQGGWQLNNKRWTAEVFISEISKARANDNDNKLENDNLIFNLHIDNYNDKNNHESSKDVNDNDKITTATVAITAVKSIIIRSHEGHPTVTTHTKAFPGKGANFDLAQYLP